MAVRIQLRRDTSANWASENPTLAQGEVGLDMTAGRFKIGDGATAWASLPYHGGTAWGAITGTLSSQTDLQNALDAKGNATTVTVNAQTGTTYTLVVADAGKLVTLANADPITVTVPENGDEAIPVDSVIALQQLGVGQVTVEGDTGVTINGVTPGDETLVDAQHLTTAVLRKTATNTWVLTGAVE